MIQMTPGWRLVITNSNNRRYILHTTYETKEEAEEESAKILRPIASKIEIEQIFKIVLAQTEYAYLLRYANLIKRVDSITAVTTNEEHDRLADLRLLREQVDVCEREIYWASQHLKEISEAVNSFGENLDWNIDQDDKANQQLQRLLMAAQRVRESGDISTVKKAFVNVSQHLAKPLSTSATTGSSKIVTQKDDDPLDYHPRPIKNVPKIPSRHAHAPGSTPARYELLKDK